MGPATAPSTRARITGITIVEVSPSSHTRPTMTRTNPTSSHEAKPRSRSHAGAENMLLPPESVGAPGVIRVAVHHGGRTARFTRSG